jgi:hypothetical protein
MQLLVDEQPFNEPKDKPDNKPAPAKVDERMNFRRDIIIVYYLNINLSEFRLEQFQSL